MVRDAGGSHLHTAPLRPAEKVALVALGGITLSVIIWFMYAYRDMVLTGAPYSTMIVTPGPESAWDRLVAIVGVLIGTLALQIVYARHLEAESQLILERNRTRELYENSPDMIVALDAEREVQFANMRTRLNHGENDPDPAAGCHYVLYQLEEPCPGCPFDEVVGTASANHSTVSYEGADGTPRWLERLLYPIRDESGSVVTVVETARDVTELRETQEALARSHAELEHGIEERTRALKDTNLQLVNEVSERRRIAEALASSELRYRAMIEDAPDMVLIHDGLEVDFINASGVRLLGAEQPSDLVGLPVLGLFDTEASELSASAVRRAVLQGTDGVPAWMKLRRIDGQLVDVEISSTELATGSERHVQCVIRDISERVRAQETIERMAFYDGLTGLPNRALFIQRLESEVARVRRTDEPLAVAFIDLDDFKIVNDTLGHHVGDAVLRAAAERLTKTLRDADTVAHLSGDEFAVIASLKKSADAKRLAERLIDGFAEPFVVEGHELHVRCSVGVAVCPEHGCDPTTLLKCADTAMYRSKELSDAQHSLYTPEMGSTAAERLRTEIDLRRAIEHDEFEVLYQPQVDIRDGKVVGVEALVRWRHPDRGLLSPASFLHVAEQAGLVTAIGRFVLDRATGLASNWNAEGLDFGRIAVNLSAREFLQPGLIAAITDCLKRTRLEPHMLEVEITESVVLHGVEPVLTALNGLRELGVRIAIDDFGTGYSSMSYLQTFPIQTLKIAQTFMRDVCEKRQSAAIAGALIDLCGALDLHVVAEGVENDAQVDFLMERGAYVVQGYAYHRPCDERTMTELLRAQQLERNAS